MIIIIPTGLIAATLAALLSAALAPFRSIILRMTGSVRDFFGDSDPVVRMRRAHRLLNWSIGGMFVAAMLEAASIGLFLASLKIDGAGMGSILVCLASFGAFFLAILLLVLGCCGVVWYSKAVRLKRPARRLWMISLMVCFLAGIGFFPLILLAWMTADLPRKILGQ